jgi:hypothetical protein
LHAHCIEQPRKGDHSWAINRYVSDELDADIDDVAPMDEIEFEESDDVETAMEVEQFLAGRQATRFAGY